MKPGGGEAAVNARAGAGGGFFRVKAGGVELDVKVTPRAGENRVEGARDGRLRVRLAAAPCDGRANAALIETLARHFSLRKSEIFIKSGAASRLKTLVLPPGAGDALARPHGGGPQS